MKTNNKGNIMNIKKIGLSALAGSLVMVSANAVELTVSGKTEVTHMSSNAKTAAGHLGNPYGMGNAITFSGSGDVNGMTATYTSVIQDNGAANSTNSEVFASASLMLDMGELGTVGFDQGIGEFGASTVDDKMPYAYEEIWNHTGLERGLRAAGSTNVLGYKNTIEGVSFSLELDPGHGAGSSNGDSGTTGTGTTDGGYNFAVSSSELMAGLNLGIGYGNEDQSDTSGTTTADETYSTAFATYAMGAATVGYQYSEGRGGSAANTAMDTTLMGISYSVNEDIAISYNEMEIDHHIGAVVSEKTTGFGASYTMGSAAVRLITTSIENKSGVVATSDIDQTEISLLLAF